MKNSLLFILLSILSSAFAQHNHGSMDLSINRFIENKGQWNSDIKFKSKLPNAEVYAKSDGIVYYLQDNEVYGSLMQQLHDGVINHDSNYVYDACIISIEFLNSNNNLNPYGKNPHTERRNYLIGNDSTKWGRNVLSYPSIFTDEVYPGIDFEMKNYNNSVKYEFQAEAHAEIKDIRLRITGHQGLEINSHGDLVIKNNIKNIIENKPVAYQIINGNYKDVPCDFYINEDQTISYKVGKGYNRRHPIVIDPQLIFSTASGSTADNWGNTACLDNGGNLYSGGTVFDFPNDGFITTTGAFQKEFQGGNTDIGILKFDSSGQNLIYATYIGGGFTEIPTSIISNNKQELFILGITSSPNFPNSVNNFHGGTPVTPVGYEFENGTDIIVIKLDSSGSNIIKSIYVGGPNNDGNNIKLKSTNINGSVQTRNTLTNNNYGDELRGEIIIDAEENIYIASSSNNAEAFNNNTTKEPLFPVKNGFQSDFGGFYQDGIVFKIHYSLDSLVWSSYIGGIGPDAAYGIKIDSDSNIFVTGICTENTFKIDSTVYNPNPFGNYDAYVAKINPTGDSILSYTYLGTSSKDAGYFIEIDKEDNVYILGQTLGDYGASDSLIYQNKNEGIFIQKLNNNLDSSYFFTTIGDNSGDNLPNISPTAFLVNECGNIFISGWGGDLNYIGSRTDDLPVTKNAFQTDTDGQDFYMAVFLQNMDSLLFATYFGVDGVAEHVDGGTSRFSNTGIVYQSVCAGCRNQGPDFDDIILFPLDSDSEYPKANGSLNCNNGVFKYDLSSLSAVIRTDTSCGPLNAKFINKTVGGVDYHWFFGDGTDTIVVNKDVIEHKYETPGKYQVLMVTTDLTTCKRKDTAVVNITVSDRLENKKWGDTLCFGDEKIWIQHLDTEFSYNWTPNTNLTNPNTRTPTHTGRTSTDYIVELTDTLNCKRFDTVNIFVPQFDPNLEVTILANCSHNSTPTIQMKANYIGNFIPDSLTWYINEFEVLTLDSIFNYKPIQFGKHDVIVQAQSKNCFFFDSSTVQLPQIKVPNIMTPNGDGKNDSFIIGGLEAGGKWKVKILNRWGKEVFYTEEYKNEWEAPEESIGTYFYELIAPDGSKCKGWLQVAD